jgi:Mn-dependent DtxR family transcriptional regulator
MDLFKDWCSQVEDKIVALINETGEIDEGKLAKKINLSTKSVAHLLKNLSEAGKVNMTKK